MLALVTSIVARTLKKKVVGVGSKAQGFTGHIFKQCLVNAGRYLLIRSLR